ncbi:MAG TPA: glycosyltransferase family 39 protein [Pyrinomonadaceae bacterium]|nr:glycosyltransferase family 39 protein [Pyrinomonadaceae bacterium]
MKAIPSRSLLAKGRSLVANHPAELICAAALILMAVNFFAIISRKTLTNDEKYHIPAGYYHLVFGDFQLNPEHPPLVKMIAAAPLLFLRPTAPSPVVSPAENPILQGHDVFLAFWEANPAKIEAISFWARVPMIILTLLLGIVLFSYARYLGGVAAATFAVIIFSLEPTILAHGRVVQTDVPAALAYLLFFFALQRLFDLPTLRRAIELGLVTGLALVIKFSLVIVAPVFIAALILIGWRRFRRDRHLSGMGLKLCSALVVLLVVVNLAYYFERAPLLPQNRQEVIVEWPTHVTALSRSFHALSTVIPPTYLFGVFVVNVHNNWGHYASILGRYSRTGWWYYFPVAFALKTTLPFLLVSVASFLWAVWAILWRREQRLMLPVFAVVLYTGFSMTSHINIGVRHFLPVIAFLILLSGAFLAKVWTQRRRVTMVLLVMLCMWMALETVRAFPNYIPYMNQLAWNHPHWYYLSDSNVEWGDDTSELAEYLLQRGETRVRAAVLGGWLSKAQYGVDYVNTLVINQPIEHTRYIAIGASFLNGSTVPLIRDQSGRPVTEEQRRDFFAAYRQRQPEAVFGNSIYLFREE